MKSKMREAIICEMVTDISYAGMSSSCNIRKELPTICTLIKDVDIIHFF